MRYLTFALAKGRLAEKTLALLEEVGITCEEMKDKNSRPIFYNGKEWTRKYPGTKNNETDEKVYETRNGKNNWLISKNVRIQYYILADGEGKYGVYNRSEYGRYIDSVWTFLRNQVKKYKDW